LSNVTKIVDVKDLAGATSDIVQQVHVNSVGDSDSDQFADATKIQCFRNRVIYSLIWNTIRQQDRQVVITRTITEYVLASDLQRVGDVRRATDVRNVVDGGEQGSLVPVVCVEIPNLHAIAAELDAGDSHVVAVDLELSNDLLDAVQKHGPVVGDFGDTTRRVDQEDDVLAIQYTVIWRCRVAPINDFTHCEVVDSVGQVGEVGDQIPVLVKFLRRGAHAFDLIFVDVVCHSDRDDFDALILRLLGEGQCVGGCVDVVRRPVGWVRHAVSDDDRKIGDAIAITIPRLKHVILHLAKRVWRVCPASKVPVLQVIDAVQH